MLPSVTLGQCDFWVLSCALWVRLIWVITAHIPMVTLVITMLSFLCHVNFATSIFLLPTKGYLIVRLQPREGG